MKTNRQPHRRNFFDKFATAVTKASGSPWAFVSALLIVVVWAVTGPMFDFSEVWQLVINTGTTIITFLMVFVIQQSQNKDTMALQLKLNELIASMKEASNSLIDIEDLSDKELEHLKKYYIKLGERAQEEEPFDETHTLERAERRHRNKESFQDGGKDQRDWTGE